MKVPTSLVECSSVFLTNRTWGTRSAKGMEDLRDFRYLSGIPLEVDPPRLITERSEGLGANNFLLLLVEVSASFLSPAIIMEEGV